jgi:hypothetical protein
MAELNLGLLSQSPITTGLRAFAEGREIFEKPRRQAAEAERAKQQVSINERLAAIKQRQIELDEEEAERKQSNEEVDQGFRLLDKAHKMGASDARLEQIINENVFQSMRGDDEEIDNALDRIELGTEKKKIAAALQKAHAASTSEKGVIVRSKLREELLAISSVFGRDPEARAQIEQVAGLAGIETKATDQTINQLEAQLIPLAQGGDENAKKMLDLIQERKVQVAEAGADKPTDPALTRAIGQFEKDFGELDAKDLAESRGLLARRNAGAKAAGLPEVDVVHLKKGRDKFILVPKGQAFTEEDLEHTMDQLGLSREEVLKKFDEAFSPILKGIK